MTHKHFTVTGMHCPSCALVIEGVLEDLGVKAACDYARGTLSVQYNAEAVTEDEIRQSVSSAGYSLSDGS